MRYKSISIEIDKLAGIESAYEEIIKDYLKNTEKKIIASPCFFIPPEINAAFNIVTLKIPEFILNKTDHISRIYSLYDAVAVPEKKCLCSRISDSENNIYRFNTPSGFGEDAAVTLHNEISVMLKSLFNIEIKSIDIEILKRETGVYEKLRRLIRSIYALRSENNDLLNNRELSLIFETGLILPPVTAIDYITPVLDEMKKITDKNEKNGIRAMLYGGKTIPADIADEIENSGIIIVEDDSCTGRRLFDISLNAESDYIFYEILDAYSYRALTPCLRQVNERYELLYKLLRNYDIETVIFFRDENCDESMKDIDFLRRKMMRDGIDPLVINRDNYCTVVSDYVSRIQ